MKKVTMITPDEFAKLTVQRLNTQQRTEEDGRNLAPMSIEEVRQLTRGDIEKLKELEFRAWYEMLEACADLYTAHVDKMRAASAEHRARLETGNEYPGVADSLRGHIAHDEPLIAVMEAILTSDWTVLSALLETPEGSEAFRWWRGRHVALDSTHPAALYYYNRISNPLFGWMHITQGGKHEPGRTDGGKRNDN